MSIVGKILFASLALVIATSASVRAASNLIGQEYQALQPEVAFNKFKVAASKLDVTEARGIATQQGGRVKPLDTLAREAMLYINGKSGRWGLSALQMYLGLAASPASPWVEIIEIRDTEVRKQLGIINNRRFASLAELENSGFEDRVNPLLAKQQENSRLLTQMDKAWIELYNQTSLARSIVLGEHLIGSIDFSHLSQNSGGSTMAKTKELVTAYVKSAYEGSPQAAAAAVQLREWSQTQKTPDLFQHYIKNINLEIFHNDARVFWWAGLLYLALAFLLLYPKLASRLSNRVIILIFLVPLLLQTLGLTIRVIITQFAPVTNMYGTMIWVAMGVNLFSLVLFIIYGNKSIAGMMLVASGFFLLITESFPLILSPDLDPIVAVLRSNFWLSTHVTTITISYAAFTIAMVLGNIYLIRRLLGHSTTDFVKEYSHHAYRAVQLGCFLLTVGIILGGIWADYSWGRFWGWDPKETWSLIADLAFLAVLHGRFIGWAKDAVFLALMPVCYLMVIMAWYGVNFVLAAGLHSYGFSSGGVAAVGTFVSAQLILIALSLLRSDSKRDLSSKSPQT